MEMMSARPLSASSAGLSGLDEVCGEATLITEQRETYIPVADDVDTVHALRGCTVKHQAAHISTEKTADVQEGLASL